ncbi:transcriptional repressor LexA [bacterium]|nr:transcriptional repressor LexA [bacterium]
MDKAIEQAREKLWRFFRREGRLPSYTEMCVLFGYSSKSSAFKLTQKLIEAGFIEKRSSGKLIPKNLSTPVKLLGSVQAGFPSPAEEELLDTLSLDDYLIRNPQASFMLKVSGDSMIDEGIMPGDLVIIERGRAPKNGQVVVAQIDGEWTLKFYEKRGDKIRLIAGNKKYAPLTPKRELQMAGIVKAVVRRYE